MSKRKFTRNFEDDFIVTAKRRIRDILINDDDIPALMEDSDGTFLYDENTNENYRGIYPFIFVPETITQDKCYICYKIDSLQRDIDNPHIKTISITFVIFCSAKKQGTGMEMNRSDAIGYCITDIFNWNNPLGLSWVEYSNEETIVEKGAYVARTIVFDSYATNLNIQSLASKERDKDGYIPKRRKDPNKAMKQEESTMVYDDPDI